MNNVSHLIHKAYDSVSSCIHLKSSNIVIQQIKKKLFITYHMLFFTLLKMLYKSVQLHLFNYLIVRSFSDKLRMNYAFARD
jgi:hypothetical protein